MEAADGGGGSFRDFWEPHVFLYSAVFLSLGLFLTHKVRHGCFGENQTSSLLWRSSPTRPCRAWAQLLQDLWSPAPQVHQGIQKQAAGEEAGGSQGLVSGPAQDGISQGTCRRSIRYLLCDNVKCSLCARVAEEATNLGCPLGLGLPLIASPQPPILPAIRDPEPSSWLGLSLPTGQGNISQSISEPAPIGGHSCLPLRDASKGYLVGSFPEKQRAHFPPSSADRVWSQVTLSSSFSSLSRVSTSSCTRGSSSSAQPQGLFRTVILQEVACEYCSQTDSEVSSDSSGQKGVSPERDGPFPSTCQGAAPDRRDEQGRQKEEPMFLGTCPCQRTGSGAVDSPFTAEAVHARLEWHLLAKRVQHKMGLPLVLLRSLGAFIPLAPAFTSGRAARTFAAMPRPQTLLFFSEDSKRELEQHLEKMVQLRRWGLPRRVQEALRHMTPGSRPTGHSSSPEDPRTESARQTAPLCNDDEAFLPAPVFQPKFPAPQKATRVEDKELPIAESVPPGHSDVQPPRGLTFQGKASNIELRSKCRPFQVVPPTQVVNKDPTLPLQMHPTPEGGDTPFTAPTDWERLEHHVLRKRFKHHWGLPRLVHQSLHRFFTAAPPPAPHLTPRLLPFQLEVKVSLSASQFRFIPEEAQRQLDGHIRSQVTERRWDLPKRAAQSLHPFMPVSPPRTKVPKEGKKGHVSPTAKRTPSAQAPTRSKRCVGLSEGEPLPSGWPLLKYQAVQRHLTKKALEIQLGRFPPVVQHSQDMFSRGRKRSLPQIAHPGPRVVQPRCPEVPFVEQIGLDRIKLNIVHKTLAHRWGLPTLHRKSLARLFHGTAPPALRFPSPTTAAGVDFPAVETPFISQQTRLELDWHVRRKHLQHLWGLPGLVQRSLRHLLPATSLLPPPRIAPEKLMVSQQPLSFLSKETQQKLDLNVRKRVILQHWGLPQVVLRALRSLCPEEEFPPLGRRAARSPLALLPCGSFPCSPSVRTFPGALADNSPAGRGGAASPHQAPVCPMVRPKEVETIDHHVARKSVEVRLGIFPAVARQSWRLALLSTRQHLPQLIHRGWGALRPRQGFLPFARVEDVDRIELAVSRNHLSSLWGLGRHYVEALAAMVPKPPTSWLTPRHPCMEFQEMPTPFLSRQDREALELSIRKKSLQHEWSLPLLIQKSLRALAEWLPMLPAPSWAEICVSALPQELPFLPPSILGHLELHVQKMKLHRQWGLPRRVLQSVRGLRPQSGSHIHRQYVAQSPLAPAHCSHCMHEAASATGALSTRHSAQRAGKMLAAAALGHSPPPFMLGPQDLEQLRLHVARKCVEVRLGAFPALARWSWRRAAFKQPLPKPLLLSHHFLQPRSHFLPFARREDLNQIELAVWHSRLRSLWGLGTLYMEAVAGLAPKLLPRPLTPSTAPFVFSEAKTPFLPEQDREAIDLLVRSRRLQHLWGLPGLVQRALVAFMPKAPSAPACPKTQILVQTHDGELFFVPPDLCRTLELHVQKMKIQRRWGLPSRVLKSLKMFLPSDSPGKMGSESRLPRSPPSPDQESPSSGGSPYPGSGPRKEGGHPSPVILPRSTVPCHPALHIHLVTRGTKPPPPVGKKDVPSGGGPLGAVQLQGKGREEQVCPLRFLLRAGAGPSNPNKKLSLIGSILEKKLHLDHGLHTWLHDRERQRVGWKEMGRKGGLWGADHTELRRDTGPGGPGRWEEGRVASSAIRAIEKAQSLRAAHTTKAQPVQASQRESLVRLRGDFVGSPLSGKPSRGIPQEKSCSVTLDRICSRGRGMVPTTKGRKPVSVNRERREQRPSSKERRPGIKEWRLSGKGQSEGQTLSCKEQRPGSKEERRPGSEEGRPGSLEKRPASEEGKPGSKKEGRPGSKEGRPGNKKEGRPGSLEKRPASEEGRLGSLERRAASEEGRPGSLEKRPGSEEGRPGSEEGRPGSLEKRPASEEGRPGSKKEGRPSSLEKRPASEEGRPGNKKEGRPGSLEKRPASEDRRPGSGVRRSRSRERRSRSTERTLSGKRPSSKEQRLSNTKHRNTAGHPKPPPPCLVKSRPEPPQRARLQQGGFSSSSKAKPEQWSGPWAVGRGSLANVLTSGHSKPSMRKGGKSIKRHILHPEHPKHQMTKTEAASGSGDISLGPER